MAEQDTEHDAATTERDAATTERDAATTERLGVAPDFDPRNPLHGRKCPWCGRWCLKDTACAYVFACGGADNGTFVVGSGCGGSFCWTCGKKCCGPYYDAASGARAPTARDVHDAACCRAADGFVQAEYCGGGCNPHVAPRW